MASTAWERFRLKTMHGNVVLNFTSYPKGELDIYAHAYREAADTLARALDRKRGYRDVDACPIVFLYRHSIELYLKAIILWGSALVRLQSGEKIDTGKLFETHRFKDLLPSLKRVCKEAGWSDHSDPNIKFGKFSEIESLILAFEEIDSRSFAFRYPIDKKGSAHLPERFHFNVVALAAEASEMLKMLDGIHTGVYEMFQNAASIMHDMADY